jgi:prepilin-type N-terminal cleavage/methylation domain-containing protein
MVARDDSIRGFTLVETLIATAILSAVIAISTYAISLASGRVADEGRGFEINASRLQRVSLLISAIEASTPWLVESGGQYGFYFLGDADGFTFVTSDPIFSNGYAVVRVLREPSENGKWRLFYEEAPISDGALVRADQKLPFTHRLLIADGFKSMKLEYFGWGSVSTRTAAIEGLSNDKPEWFVEYDGLSRKQNPRQISIELDRVRSVVSVADRADFVSSRVVTDT